MPMNLTFSIILEPQLGGGFTVLVPALPEVVSEGDTEEEALVNVRKRSARCWRPASPWLTDPIRRNA